LLAGMHVHAIVQIHIDQAWASREVLSNKGLQMLNPEYMYIVLAQEKHLFCRLESSLLTRFKINDGNYRAGTI